MARGKNKTATNATANSGKGGSRTPPRKSSNTTATATQKKLAAAKKAKANTNAKASTAKAKAAASAATFKKSGALRAAIQRAPSPRDTEEDEDMWEYEDENGVIRLSDNEDIGDVDLDDDLDDGDIGSDLGDQDIDDNTLGEQGDIDAEMEQVQPARRRKRAMTPAFASSGPAAVGQPRALRSPSRNTALPAWTPSPRRGTPARLYTPYVDQGNPREPSKPLLGRQTPMTQAVVKRATQLFRADTIADTAFLDHDGRVKLATKHFHTAARELNADRRILRFEGDLVYQENILKMIMRCDSQVRGEVVYAARLSVGSSYGLGTGRGNPEDNKNFVGTLLTKSNFVFRELDIENPNAVPHQVARRIGPYRHHIIASLIEQEFFHNHEQMAVADATRHLFNPMPIPVIAFVATAIQCALCDWTSGVRIRAMEFSAEEWTDVYDKHVGALENMKAKNRRLFTAWTRKLYKDCWSTTRQYLAATTADDTFLDDAELDDFDDVDGLAAELAEME